MDKLQWGKRKRLRCVKVVKDSSVLGEKSTAAGGGDGAVRKKITSRVLGSAAADTNRQIYPSPPLQSPHCLSRDLGTMNKSSLNENTKVAAFSSSPEKEDRYYTTRGSIGLDHDNGKLFTEPRREENKGEVVWPKLFVALSSKEKEEDFMAMKGCKLPQRPKKRAKLIQRTLLLVSPGAWLSDLCQERYEVREKKSSKKRPRGLKAMGSMESDSE
ncbi:hypothetical protein RHMOL_Rhmol01G0247100 [Rhododendron molle]|uniref:Uncharacterized protein n=2 Tax=Rhododendron molle TaxID=49168 RepID=A0ACC0Q6E4_RHOML|nr:hypothetical protein RHMOL_Rhmol01G0247100 [Rhododendron molle]KAI8573022.1 hypothetical protein RHMOL_Rhmol01G0247100 [Rhododendron molle]